MASSKVADIDSELIAQFEDLSVKSEERSECFPRCEYYVRFKGTSAFSMADSQYWGTYFRSTVRGGKSDRLSKLESKYYNNTYTNKMTSPASKTGTFNSPWKNVKYQSIFSNNSLSYKRSCKDGILYDELLEYKNIIVEEICGRVHNDKDLLICKRIEVYCCNDYPCVMVKIENFNFVRGEKSSLYDIACAYFIALCNNTAVELGVPVEIVMRPSFGHNTPSLAETSTSFRISIGIVPLVYSEVITKSLIKFNNWFLDPLFNGELRLNMDLSRILNHNVSVKEYNVSKTQRKRSCQKVDVWDQGEPLFNVLCKVGDSRGSKVSYQLMRKRLYVDLLANYVSEEVNSDFEPNFSNPLIKMLNHLVYEKRSDDQKATLSFNPNIFHGNLCESFYKLKENYKIRNDVLFWNIIGSVASYIQLEGEDLLQCAVDERKLYGLYSKLEKSNLNFIQNSFIDARDGHGSESDCEIRDCFLYYSKKLIVATGMRAISLASFVSKYHLRQLKRKPLTDTCCMYYETSEAIKYVSDVFETLLYNNEDFTKTATVKYIDLNGCAVSGPKYVNLNEHIVSLSNFDIVVVDYTSAQVKKIRQAVNLCINKVHIVILINSGLKNEQIGADMNPYGTIRIVTKDLALLNELYFVLKRAVKSEVLPMKLHSIRKAYKAIGAVVTNRAIYTNCSYLTSSNEDYDVDNITSLSEEDYKLIQFINDDTFRGNISLLFGANLQGALITFFNNNHLENLNDSIDLLCNFSIEHSVSSDINELSFDDLKTLLILLNTDFYDKLDRLIGTYGQNICDVIHWERDAIQLLGSNDLKDIIDDTEYNFDDILSCYSEDEYITECIINFCMENDKSILFMNDDFKGVFDTLFWKHSKDYFPVITSPSSGGSLASSSSMCRNESDSDSISDNAYVSFPSWDESFDYEDALWHIYQKNLESSIPAGYFTGSSGDEAF